MQRTRITSALLFLLVSASFTSASKNQKLATGGGGFPINESTTSMWAAVDEISDSLNSSMTFMIYYKGKPGWHKTKWQFKQNLGDKPAVIEFYTDKIDLKASFERKSRELTLFKKRINVDKTNIILVSDVDSPGKENVTGIAHMNLKIPEAENPALWVLNSNFIVSGALSKE
jgi:hypothetical protein